MSHVSIGVQALFPANRGDEQSQAWRDAQKLYERAYSRGRLGRLWSFLHRRSNCLLDAATIAGSDGELGNPFFAGRRAVPIDQIGGSFGRYDDFDRDFYPIQDHTEQRWLRVATARRLGKPLPPVSLVQVGDVYFVKDGHHRISVARALGQPVIDAEVTVWQPTGSNLSVAGRL